MSKKLKTVRVVKKYAWAGVPIHNRAKLDVQLVGKTLDEIVAAKQHRAKAEDIVAAAVDPKSPIHAAFEWDDSECGKEHRLEQARILLRSYQVLIVREDKPDTYVRANLAIEAEDDGRKSTYGGVVETLSDEEMRALYLKQAIQYLLAFKKRFMAHQDLAQDLAPVFSAINRIARKAG